MKLNKSKIKAALLLSITTIMLHSCNDDFLNKYPETDITEAQFFTNVNDLELYTNSMYSYLSASYRDLGTDNMFYLEDATIFQLMRGEILPSNVSTWDWSDIRNVNFMLTRTDGVEGDESDINHYIGIARMWRAKLYYDKVKTYSDVPWYDKDLSTTDTEELFKTQDSREYVVEKIIEDLEFAVANINDVSSKTLIGKNVARMMLANVALYEGTFRKYHTELGLTDGDDFLTVAYQTAEDIMDSGEYSISMSGEGDYEAYESLFNSNNLSSNSEVIYMIDYDKSLGVTNNTSSILEWNSAMSKNLVEEYLYIVDENTTVPFTSIDDYDKKTYLEVFENRDPRLLQTVMQPGFVEAGKTDPTVPGLSRGGYPQIKFQPTTYDQIDWNTSYTDLPVYRYAETLLIFAEAKAELGILTQSDIDRSISLLRSRVGMPTPELTDWLANIDSNLQESYSNVTGSQTGAILEIRRERRVELACEGQRYGDLMRWSCGKLFETPGQGIYIPYLGFHDLTGDGVNDIAIFATSAEVSALTDAEKEEIVTYALEGNTIRLSEDDKGYVIQISQEGVFDFLEPKYYYTPLAREDLQYNTNLVQNQYWL